MERDGGRKCEIVLPLAKQDLICSSGEHSSSPRVSPGGEQARSVQRGFDRMALCISCSEMPDQNGRFCVINVVQNCC